MDTTTQQQFIAGAPIHVPGPAKCGTIERLDARFELSDVTGDIRIEQTGFDLYTVEVSTVTDVDHSARVTTHRISGEDVVDCLTALLHDTTPSARAALVAAYCHGQSYNWATIRDVAIERIDDEYRERMEHKYGGREDVSF